MERIPTELFPIIFANFLPPLVLNIATTNDIPLDEEVKLFKALSACKLVCKKWRDILERPSYLSRDAYNITEGSKLSLDRLRAKNEYVERVVVKEASNTKSSVDSVFTACPNVRHVSWTCDIPRYEYLRRFSYPPLDRLRRLDWRFLISNFMESAIVFGKLVENSPALECITFTEAEGGPFNPGLQPLTILSIPSSVATLGYFSSNQRGSTLLDWFGYDWNRASKHVITSGRWAREARINCSRIELRPNPSSTLQPAEFDLENFIFQYLPLFGDGSRKATLIYSCTTYAPVKRITPVQVEWINKIALKTSGSSYRTEDEKWNAVKGHLNFVLKGFPNLESVDLCDDFQE